MLKKKIKVKKEDAEESENKHDLLSDFVKTGQVMLVFSSA